MVLQSTYYGEPSYHAEYTYEIEGNWIIVYETTRDEYDGGQSFWELRWHNSMLNDGGRFYTKQ